MNDINLVRTLHFGTMIGTPQRTGISAAALCARCFLRPVVRRAEVVGVEVFADNFGSMVAAAVFLSKSRTFVLANRCSFVVWDWILLLDEEEEVDGLPDYAAAVDGADALDVFV